MKPTIGTNDLQSQYPELAKEWDYEKNNLNPSQVVIGSPKHAAWKCSICGNEWKTAIRHRTQRNSGCPKCAEPKRIISHRKAFLTKNGCITNSLLLKEWDYNKNDKQPTDMTKASNEKVWWVCSRCGYNYEAQINNRSNGRGCPCCSNKVTVKGINDLATTHPELAKEWHPTKNGTITPFNVVHGCGKKVWWRCDLGHEYQATILHRSHGTNCPVCNSGRQTSFAEQAIYYYIKKIFPDAIGRYTDIFDNRMELDIYIPTIKTAIEYDGVFWHKSAKSVKNENIKYGICQEHGIKLIRIREAQLENTFMPADECWHMDGMDKPDIFNDLIQRLVDKLDPQSNPWTRKEPWLINMHSKVKVNVVRDGLEIRKYMMELKEDSLAVLRPDLALEWHPTKNSNLIPNMFSLGSSVKVWWKCATCGHEWKTAISHRTHRTKGTGCHACHKKQNAEQHPLALKIYQYSKSGEFIQEWKSISDASRALSINNSNITMCAKHLRKYAGGFSWEYSKVTTESEQLSFL
jgi:DNA-directed RNA polymerase subunit RPC12/RpoP